MAGVRLSNQTTRLLDQAKQMGLTPDGQQELLQVIEAFARQARKQATNKSQKSVEELVAAMIMDVDFDILNDEFSAASESEVFWVLNTWKRLMPLKLQEKTKALDDATYDYDHAYAVAVVMDMTWNTLRTCITRGIIKASVVRQILIPPPRNTFACEAGADNPYRCAISDALRGSDTKAGYKTAVEKFDHILATLWMPTGLGLLSMPTDSFHYAIETMKAVLLHTIKAPQFKQADTVWQQFWWKVEASVYAFNRAMTPGIRECATQIILGLVKNMPDVGSYEVVKILLTQHSSPQTVENWLATNKLKAEAQSNLLSLRPQNMAAALCDWRRGIPILQWLGAHGYHVTWDALEKGLEHGDESVIANHGMWRWKASPEYKNFTRIVHQWLGKNYNSLDDSEKPVVYDPSGNVVPHTKELHLAFSDFQRGQMAAKGSHQVRLFSFDNTAIKRVDINAERRHRTRNKLPWCETSNQNTVPRITFLVRSSLHNMAKRANNECIITNLDDKLSRNRVLLDRAIAMRSGEKPTTWTAIKRGLCKTKWKHTAHCTLLCNERAGRGEERRPAILPLLPAEMVDLIIQFEFYLWQVPRKEQILIEEVD